MTGNNFMERLQYASGWFLTEEIPDNWWADDTNVKSEEEVNEWLESKLKERYKDWSADLVWINIESLASVLVGYERR